MMVVGRSRSVVSYAMPLLRGFALRSLLGLLVVSTGCASTTMPIVDKRTRRSVHNVKLTGLPPGCRILEEHGTSAAKAESRAKPKRRVLALVAAGGAHDLAFPVDVDEDVRDGNITKTAPRRYEVTLDVTAPGHLPRVFHLTVPGSTTIDARLQRPAVSHVPGAPRAIDAARVRFLVGRCSEGVELAAALDARSREALAGLAQGCATRHARRFGASDDGDWDPKALGLPDDVVGSAGRAAGALDASLAADEDDAGRRALVLLDRLARVERLDEAAHIAELVAAPLSPKRAALALTLPQAALAARRLNVAAAKLAAGDTRLAFEAAADARAVAPWVATKGYAAVRAARVKALEEKARAREADAPLVARAYWHAVTALAPQASEAVAGLERTTPAMLARLRARILVRAADAESLAVVREVVPPLLPRHVALVEDEAEPPDGVLLFAISETQRTHQARTVHRTKNVVAFEHMNPNPAWEAAQQELVSAEDALGPARDAHRQLRQQAAEMKARASQGGIAGGIAASGAIAQEVGALAILRSAENRVRNARAAVARTPRLVKDVERRDVAYPVLVFTTEAKRHVRARLDGFDETFEDERVARAELVREHELPSPEIGVPGSPSPHAELSVLQPAIAPAATELARIVVARIAAAETAAAARALAAARTTREPAELAAAAAAYLEIVRDEEKRTALARVLAEELP
jgi:hypothetical protein